MQIDIDDKNLSGFNDPAKVELKKATLQFSAELVKESFRLEAGQNTTSGTPQVTSSMVSEAAILIRRGLGQSKKKLSTKMIRIAAAVLPMMVGFAYDTNRLQDKIYMFIFILFITLAVIAVTISIITE